MTFAEFLSALAAAGMSRRSLADVLGVHIVTVNRWATGALPVPMYASAYLELARSVEGKPLARVSAGGVRGG